ncbi:hypothetical protein J1N35_001276 [Gossypium stocksii]|uniref:Zinc finger GRF-type domain-containing protein n=1 Tax=Gossypium stocksii TaxID=47602 RepID=A0A9D3WK49_9ROSI|nr:hypothetical protein J1N35_001276 [Gossypium stocksii]
MESHSSNSQSRGWSEYVYDGPAVKCHYNKLVPRDTSWSDINLERRFYGCSYFRDGDCDFYNWYVGKMCDHATELLRQLHVNERNLLKDNLALRKNVMDWVAFDSNHSAIDIEVERGRLVCGVEGKVVKMLTVKQKIKVIKKEKSMYKILFSCSMLCIVCITICFFFGSSGKRHMQLAVANVD